MRDRTADPLLAKQVLSQLSYTPISSFERLRALQSRALKIKQRFLYFRNADLGFYLSRLVTLHFSSLNSHSSNPL